MTKTINRTPSEVYVPTEKNLGYGYFGYDDWKGKCTNKNFIGIDQSTFEDCNNIYIDRDNVLRSRPAIKKYKVADNIDDVVKVWTFGPWTVYWDGEKVNFVVGTSVYTEALPETVTRIYLVQADEKIFVFGNNSYAYYFDIVTYQYKDATDLIYIPVTKIYSLNTEKDLESLNKWSNKHRERYIWSRNSNTNLSDLVGKTVTVQLKSDDEEYTITSFEKYQEYTVTKDTDLLLTTANYCTYTINSKTTSVPMVDVSKYNSVVYAEIVTKTVNTVKYNYYKVYYSVNGVSYSELGELPWDDTSPYNCYYKPQFSTDGTIVYVYTSKGVYAISVLNDSIIQGYRYSDWTNICTEYKLPSSVTYTDVGSAHMYSYNTFSVCPSITSSEVTTYIVREGTLSTKSITPASTVTIATTCKVKVFCNLTRTFIAIVEKNTQSSIYSSHTYAIVGVEDSAKNVLVVPIYNDDISLSDKQLFNILRLEMYANSVGNCELLCAPVSTNTLLMGNEVSYLWKAYQDTDGSYTTIKIVFNTTAYVPFVAESAESILTASLYKYNTETMSLSTNRFTPYVGFVTPIAVKNGYIYYLANNKLYSSFFDNEVYFTTTVTDNSTVSYDFDCEAELASYYISVGKDVYISAKGAYQDVDFTWYFPDKYAEHFDYEITGLHPISTTEIAVFTEDSIYYVTSTTVTIDEVEQSAYLYYKSRIPLGCTKGSDIVTSYDGKYTIFATKRGLVAMAYQDFVSSTEQALTFLSDNISEDYYNWYANENKVGIKLTLFKYWLIMYTNQSNQAYVYDMRNSSWWPVTYRARVKQIIEIDKELRLLSLLRMHKLDTGDVDYKDDIGNIEWMLRSQKLHFSAINYYKTIRNITLSSVMDSSVNNIIPFTCDMKITTYRKIMDGTQAPETMAFYVDMVRTYVKGLNYMKIGQFQFELDSDENNVKRTPLSLTSICIKYKTTGQVR